VRVDAARLFGLAAACLAVWASHATAATTGIGISGVPRHVVSGTVMHVTVSTVDVTASCSLNVKYRGGRTHAQWVWTIPPTVTAGVAHAYARCGNVSLTRTFLVVGKVTKTPVPVDKGSVVVVKSGFTTRTDTSGSTRLSYGVILHNTSQLRDAGSMTLQTNFVMADGHLLGTDTERINGIAAASDFAYGNTVYFPQAAPIVRLEFVVTVDNFQPHKLTMPTLVNLHLVPENFQPQWVGTIEGELQNTNTALTLHGVQLSAVVFDSTGAVIGGTSGGYISDVLPVGARAFLQITNLDVLPTDRAAGVMVSMVPTWATS
jgi:hypothetical protein